MNQFPPAPEYSIEEKIYLYVNSTTQRCPKERMKISDCRFFPFATSVNDTGGALELRISPRIFEKIRNGSNSIIRGLGETDPSRKPEVKNLVDCPFKALPFFHFSAYFLHFTAIVARPLSLFSEKQATAAQPWIKLLMEETY